MFFAGGAFETPWYLRGLEQFLIDLRQQPEIAEAICRHVEEYYRLRALRVLEVAGDRIDLIGTGGDIGTQRGMMLNPALWRRHIKPYTGRLIRTFKSLGYTTFYHSCGSLVPVIPDLIEVGLDLLDPIQPQAAGMTRRRSSSRSATGSRSMAASTSRSCCPTGRRSKSIGRRRGSSTSWGRTAATSWLPHTTSRAIRRRRTWPPCARRRGIIGGASDE